MKRFILILLSLSYALLIANFVRNQPIEFTQPDGTVVNAFVTGDESYHRVHDAADYTLLLHPRTGYAVYAIANGSSVIASEYIVNRANPAALGITPGLFATRVATADRQHTQQSMSNAGARAQSVGMLNNVLVFVRFSDQTEFPAATPYSGYADILNSTTDRSLKDYYREVSDGQLTINSHLLPAADTAGSVVSVQVSHPRGYYSPYNEVTNPDGYDSDGEAITRKAAWITELSGLVDPLLPDDIDVDSDNDDATDGLTLIIRGGTDSWGDILWPQRSAWNISLGTLNGVDVKSYILTFEGGLGVSVLCHEMGHNLGAPDYYHYHNAAMGDHEPWASISPVQGWDLMASDNAQHWLTYTKWKYAQWFATLPTITPTSEPVTYTLPAVDQSPYACFKIASSDPQQFYMLEYRRQAGRYDVGIPGSGLIVYRVISSLNGTTINGNAEGPADEVYVYRPGGVVDTPGSPSSAYFSDQSGRTALHNFTDPKPWIYADTLSTPDGNLIITDIGASGGETISFVIRNYLPKTWTGAVNSDWHTATNWLNGIPAPTDEVIIPAGCSRYPQLTADAGCHSLILQPAANLTIQAATLSIEAEIHLYGRLEMNDELAHLMVQDMVWDTGSTAAITAEADIYITGNLDFLAGSDVQMQHGNIAFRGTGNSILKVNAETELNHLRADKTNADVVFSSFSTADLHLNGNLFNYDSSRFYFNANQTLYISGSYQNAAAGLVSCPNGTIIFDGNHNQSIREDNPASRFNNLYFQLAGNAALSLQSTLRCNGNLQILSGMLMAENRDIAIQGNWSNYAGVGSFNAGTGRVIFCGTADQYCYGETFHTLVLDKPAGELVFPALSQTSCAYYDWEQGAYRVAGGWFVAADLMDNSIYGSITLDGGNIEYTQDAGNFVNIRAALRIYSGDFTINGGTGDCYIASSSPSSLIIEGGKLEFTRAGIVISDAAPAQVVSITGGTLKTAGAVDCRRMNVHFDNCTLELTGTGNVSLQFSAGCSLNHLKINKAATRSAASHREGAGIYALSPLLLHGNLLIDSGCFDLNSQSIEVEGFIDIYARVKMTAGADLICHGDVYWRAGSTSEITTGVIQCGGNWLFAAGSRAELLGTTTTFIPTAIVQITVSGSDSWFGNLILLGNVNPELSTYTLPASGALEIRGNLTVYGGNMLDLSSRAATVSGSLTVYATGGIATDNGGSLSVQGTFANSGWLNVGSGSVVINAAYLSDEQTTLLIAGGAFTVNAPAAQTAIYLRGAIHLQGGLLEVNAASVVMRAFGDRIFSSGTVRIGGSFTANEAGAFQPQGGYLSMTGATNSDLDVSNGNYLHHLTINMSPAMPYTYLRADLSLHGNLDIQSGGIIAGDHDITLAGYWQNSAGVTAFVPGSGSVIFNKSGGAQAVTGVTCFYDITDAHTGTLLQFNSPVEITNALTLTNGAVFYGAATLNSVQNSVTTAELKFYGNSTSTLASYAGGGSLIAGLLAYVIVTDIATADLAGNYSADNAVLELHQDYGNYIDINGSITVVNDGRIDIYGGCMESIIGSHGNVVITMDSGELNFVENGIVIEHSYAHTLTCNITGGVIRTATGFWNYHPGFHPTGGSVECYGSQDGQISMAAGSSFHDLTIVKTPAPDTRSQSIILLSDLVIQGDLLLQSGTFDCGSNHSIEISNDVNIAATACLNAGSGAGIEITVGRNWTDANVEQDAIPVTQICNLLCGGICNPRHKAHLTDQDTDTAETYLPLHDKSRSTYPVERDADPAETGLGCAPSFCVGVCKTPHITDCKSVLPVEQDADPAETYLTLQGKSRNTYPATRLANYGFLPGTSLLTFAGSTPSLLSVNGAAFQAANLTINKATGIPITPAVGMTGLQMQNLTVNSGVFRLGSLPCDVSGDIAVNSGGVLEVGADGSLSLSAPHSLTVNSGGALQLLGSSGHNAVLTHQTGFYALDIAAGGSISAEYATFEYMNADGLNIQSGALVDTQHALANCTFRRGAAGGTLLTIDNSQSLTLSGLIFPANTWAGASNVAKNVDAGIVTLENVTGEFGTVVYENDVFGRIHWQALPDMPTPTLTYDALQQEVILQWSYPVAVDHFNVYRSTDPLGANYLLLGSSVTNSYHDLVLDTSAHYFYRVTAVKNQP